MRTAQNERLTLAIQRNRWACAAALAAIFFLAQQARAETPDLSSATRPLNDGIPQVTVVRLRNLLEQNISAADRTAAMAKLAEALVASEQPAEALKLLADAALANLPDKSLLEAQANAELGRWEDALICYRRAAASDDSPSHADALFGQAEALRALSRGDEALRVLSSLRTNERWSVRAQFRSVELLLEKQNTGLAARLLQSVQARSAVEKKERRFLSGRIALAQRNRTRAMELFAPLLKASQGVTQPLVVATLIALAEANLQSNTPGAGDDFLEEFIEHHPGDPDLAKIFAKLDQLYAAERSQSRHEFVRWSNDEAQPRRGLSLWYLARAELRMGHPDLALQAFDQLRETGAPISVSAGASLEHARFQLQLGRFADALAALDVARSRQSAGPLLDRMNLLAGEIEYRAGRYDSAVRAFQQVAEIDSPFAGDALYNVSLGWLQQRDDSQFAAAKHDLLEKSGDPQLAADLLLEQGLLQASRHRNEAVASLQKFVHDFPNHPRAAEAWVALAELAFHSTPPRIDEALKHLVHAAEGQPSNVSTERADYLAIWIQDASDGADDAKLITRANDFLQKYPASSQLPAVRLKLAEIYFRRQDFPSAQTQFEILAQQNPGSPEAEKAQFFAAQAAMQSMSSGSLDRALILFDRVVKGNGELKWAARIEQAVIERKLGKPQDALTLYDEVTRGEVKPAERREALCGKGDVLYELGTTDPENYHRAIALYDDLAAEKDAPPHWRNQALFKKGMCLEKLDAPAEALATFYTIVEDDSRSDRQREYFWFYKAGFNAARLLEEQSSWQPAAAIYEKLAFAGGARSGEAKSRLNQLRLAHFLWEQ